MAEASKIPISWHQRWRRIRYNALPLVSFLATLVAIAVLWKGQTGIGTAVGEVVGTRMDLASKVGGQLVELPYRRLELFAPVATGDVVARLDDQDLLAQLDVLKEELAHLETELAKIPEEARVADADRSVRQFAEARQLAEQIDSLSLKLLALRTKRQIDLVLVAELKDIYDLNKDLRKQEIITQQALLQAESNYEVAKKRIEETAQAMLDVKKLLSKANKRMDSQPAAAVTEVAKLLGPARSAIAVQEKRIHELEVRREALEIRSPIDGTIAAILKRPGQTVLPNEPILTVVSAEGQYVISYIRQGRGPAPLADMAVDLRTRSTPRELFHARVETVGPQVESVPPHQQRDPRISEWGLPVRIELPAKAFGKVRPGELLDVRLLPQSSATSDDERRRPAAANEAKLHKPAGT